MCACKWFGIEIYGDFYFQNRIHDSVEVNINNLMEVEFLPPLNWIQPWTLDLVDEH